LFDTASSSAPRADNASRPVNNRAKVSNRSRLHASVDGRTVSARRFRDLVCDFAAPLGGFDNLSEADAVLVREVAAKTIEAEVLQAKLANGEATDSNSSVRVGNVLSRLLAQLERRRRALAPKSPTLADILRAAR
jgi:hypothetical protein